jgi:hypothetical protein
VPGGSYAYTPEKNLIKIKTVSKKYEKREKENPSPPERVC